MPSASRRLRVTTELPSRFGLAATAAAATFFGARAITISLPLSVGVSGYGKVQKATRPRSLPICRPPSLAGINRQIDGRDAIACIPRDPAE